MDIEEPISNYRPSEAAIKVVSSTPLILLVGISGAGKDTVKKVLLETGQYHDFVSYTTRQPRINNGVAEQDGVEYHFVTMAEMQKLLRNGEMIEAKVYGGNVYGTGIYDLELAKLKGKVAINDIEVQGVREYKNISPNVKAVFLLPPSYEEWRRRLKKRYGESDATNDNLNLRLATSKDELREALESGFYIFVINDVLAETVDKLSSIAKETYTSEEQESSEEHARQLFEVISTQLD